MPFPGYLLSPSSHASMDVQHSRSRSLIFFSGGRCGGVGGGGDKGGWLCTTARSLIWCKRIISFDVSWIRSVRLEKNLHFSVVFKQIVALVFLQNAVYIRSKESLWFSPNIVHWLFSNTVNEIKWITKSSASPVFNTRSPSPIIPQLPASFNFNLANFIWINICKYTTQHKEPQHDYLCCVKCDTG